MLTGCSSNPQKRKVVHPHMGPCRICRQMGRQLTWSGKQPSGCNTMKNSILMRTWPGGCFCTPDWMAGDEAALVLAQCLMTMWRWMAAILESITCLLAPTILNIGKFLYKKPSGSGWSEQQWLEAYSRALQCLGEAAVGRCWNPIGKGFAPH